MSRTCQQEGCGRRYYARGRCEHHYKMFRQSPEFERQGVQSSLELTTFGENVRLILEKRGCTMTALARRAGIDRAVLFRAIYKTSMSPKLNSLQFIADALEIPLWQLLKPEAFSALD